MKEIARGKYLRSARDLIAIALVSVMLTSGTAAFAGGDKAGANAALVTGTEAGASAAFAAGNEAGAIAALPVGDKKPVFISGNSTSSDCGLEGSEYALAMTGELEGCWSGFIQGFTCQSLGVYDLYTEQGREVFVGKYQGQQGRFRTTYTFEGAYAKGFCHTFDPRLEVGGGCNHPLMGVGGVFAHAKGVIKFIDVIAGVTGDPATGEFHPGSGANNFVYYGRIDFDHED